MRGLISVDIGAGLGNTSRIILEPVHALRIDDTDVTYDEFENALQVPDVFAHGGGNETRFHQGQGLPELNPHILDLHVHLTSEADIHIGNGHHLHLHNNARVTVRFTTSSHRVFTVTGGGGSNLYF